MDKVKFCVTFISLWTVWPDGLSKKSPNVYKKLPKLTKKLTLEKWKDYHPFSKIAH